MPYSAILINTPSHKCLTYLRHKCTTMSQKHHTHLIQKCLKLIYPIMFNFTLYECAEIVHIKNVDVPAGDDVYHSFFKCSEDF